MSAQVSNVADQYKVSPYVPMESFVTAQPHCDYQDYHNYLHHLCDAVDQHNDTQERRRHQKWLTCENFYQSIQVGRFNHRGEFDPLEYESGDPIYICNFYGHFIQTIVKEVVRSRARIEIKPILDMIRHRAAARLYDAQLKQIQKRNWLASEKEREAKQLVLRGNSFRRIRRINDYNDIQLIPITALIERPLGRDTFGCTNADCAHIGMVEELTPDKLCPECESPVLVKPAGTVQMEEVEKYEAKPAQAIDIDVADTFAVKINLHSRSARESDYLRYAALIEPSVARYFYRWANIGSGQQADSGQRSQLELQRSAGNWNGEGTVNSGSANYDLVDYKEYYFEPSRYCDYVAPRDAQMAGKVLREGEMLLEHFPRGMKVTRLGTLIVDVQAAEKNREWVQVQWDQLNSSAWALGVGEHIIEPQRASNEMMSLFWEILLREASGLTIINQNKIDRSQLVYKPGYVGTMRNPVANDNPGNYIFTMPSSASRPDLMAGIEANKANFTILARGAFSTDGALPNQAGADTATGMNILREQSLANLAPALEQIAESDVRTAEICCDLIKEHDLGTQYVRTHPEYHELEYEAYQECDPRTDFEISYAEGSYMPRLESERRSEFIAANEQGAFDPNLPKEYRDRVARAFNQPLTDGTGETQKRDEEIVLMKLETLSQKAAAAGVDEEQAAMEVAQAFPVRLEHDGELRTAYILYDYLLTDPGRKANNYMRRFLYDRINLFREASVRRAQADQMQMMAANAPAAQAQMAAAEAPANPSRQTKSKTA